MAILAAPIRNLVGAPDPNATSTDALDIFGLPTGPSSEHLFGVDGIGRDVFSRVLSGAQVSLMVAFIGTGLSVMIGVTFGHDRRLLPRLGRHGDRARDRHPARVPGAAARPRPRVRVLDQGGLPGRRAAARPAGRAVRSSCSRTGPTSRASSAARCCRCARRSSSRPSTSLGASNGRIIFREILPNLVAPIIVYTTLFIPANILLEAALSFLGVGVQDRATWGGMLSDAAGSFDTAWWYMFFPGMALLLTVLAFNLLGDGMQDALNPKSAKQR